MRILTLEQFAKRRSKFHENLGAYDPDLEGEGGHVYHIGKRTGESPYTVVKDGDEWKVYINLGHWERGTLEDMEKVLYETDYLYWKKVETAL